MVLFSRLVRLKWLTPTRRKSIASNSVVESVPTNAAIGVWQAMVYLSSQRATRWFLYEQGVGKDSSCGQTRTRNTGPTVLRFDPPTKWHILHQQQTKELPTQSFQSFINQYGESFCERRVAYPPWTFFPRSSMQSQIFLSAGAAKRPAPDRHEYQQEEERQQAWEEPRLTSATPSETTALR